jgi:ArsR family transcriptional regulator
VKTKIANNLDEFIKILENPIRRKIIEFLSQEPSFSLRLSKQLSLGQQLVTKHLNIMEKAGLVESKIEDSPRGAQRRIFWLSKSFSIIIDVAPHLFKQNIISFEVEPEERHVSKTTISLMERRDKLLDCLNEKERMKPFSTVLSDIDSKLDILEQERALLLWIRNSIMKEASKIIQKIDDIDSRRVFHQALDEHDNSVEKISKSLNLREEQVNKIIQKLKNEFETEYFK